MNLSTFLLMKSNFTTGLFLLVVSMRLHFMKSRIGV